ncbi:hypothetical protein [Streptomyces sp. 147326]|uniref:hypothetical protein n=1 Tax=Streptomyces sp. 147326 TaxID=3074379 RepID=UPI00385775C3
MTAPTVHTGRRGTLGADIASAVLLIVIELLGLAAVFFAWVLANLDFAPESTG